VTYSDEEDNLSTSSESFASEEDTPSDSDSHLTPEQKKEIRRHARKAAVKAREKIRKEALSARSKRADIKKAAAKKAAKKREEEEEEEEEEDEEDEEEEDEEDEEGEDDDEEEDEHPGITLNIGTFGEGSMFEERMTPRRYNMKKESDIIKKFVKLVSEPVMENTIDDQIDQFKTLTEEKQNQMLAALERKPVNAASENLMFRILTMNLPVETQQMVMAKYNSLQTLDTSSGEYFKMRAWLEKVSSLPLGIYKELPVKLEDGSETCGVFMERSRKYLAEAIYGQDEAKMQILQFIAGKIANPVSRGTSILLAGPPGIGKTSLIRDGIAKAVGWPFQFISLGGDSDASTYTGHQMVYESSHCGKIVNSIVAAKSMSMILMFDEVDKISTTAKGEEVMNLLIHLTDPVQNGDFEDKYLAGIPLDLSRSMFAFSGNDLAKIDRVLLDRMIVVNLSGYNAKEKLAIAENFVVPTALKEVHLGEKVHFSKEVLQYLIEKHASQEPGVRGLKRCIDQMVQKINMLRMFNNKDLPFYIKDFQLPFVVKKEHIDLFLKEKKIDESISHLYT
jgi:ATP-dependent Lon protease